MEALRFPKTSAEEREKTYKFCSLTYVRYMYCSLITCINACPNVLSFFQPNNRWICNYAICSYPDYSNNKYTICTMSQNFTEEFHSWYYPGLEFPWYQHVVLTCMQTCIRLIFLWHRDQTMTSSVKH